MKQKTNGKSLYTGLKKTAKNIFYGGLLTGSLAAGYGFFGIDGISNAAAFPTGEIVARKIEKRKITLEDIAKQSVSGLAMTPVFQKGWEVMEKYLPVERLSNIYSSKGSIGAVAEHVSKNAAEYLGRTAAITGAFMPYAVGVNQSIDYLVDNRSFRGMYSSLKEKWWPTTKKAMKQVAPLVALNTFLIPSGLNIAVGSVISAVYRVVLAFGNKGKAKESNYNTVNNNYNFDNNNYATA